MKSIIATLFQLLSCCLMLGQQTGNTPGNLSVSMTGNSIYSVPLLTSPGRSPQPKLSLVINSQSTNGIAGNADLTGVSQQITRAGKTKGVFGVNTAIGLNANDVFSLNGDPVKLTNGKKYGSDGATYSPQHNPDIEVQSIGDISNTGTPLFFIVKTKDNLTLQFGFTADSRIEPVGSNIPIHYMLNKVTDVSGNYYTIKYLEAEGQAYPLEISYTGNVNAGLKPYNTIKFYFQNYFGPDQFVAGTRIRKTKILTSIKSYHGETLFREYRLQYKKIEKGDKSLVAQITECGLNGACLNPTKFEYSADFSIKEKANQGVIKDLKDLKTILQIQAIDLNMDGVSDLLVTWKKDGTNNYYRTILITNNDFETLSSSVVSSLYSRVLQFGQPQNNSSRVFVKQISEKITEQEAREQTEYVQADFNGDGKTDLVIVTESYLRVVLNVTVNGSVTLQDKFIINLENDVKKGRVVVGDFNSDGLSDIIMHRGDKGTGYYFKKSTSAELTYEKKCCQFPTNLNAFREGDFYDFIATDFDSDGNLDLLVKTRRKVAILKSSQQKFTTLLDVSNKLTKDGDILSLHAVDINNDGLTDLVKSFRYSCGVINDNIKYAVHWNNGKLIFSTTTKELIKGNFARNTPSQIFFADFNLDGNADMGVIGQFGNERCKSGLYGSFFNRILLITGDGKGNFTRELSSSVFNAEQGKFERGELFVLPGRFFSTPSINLLAIHKKKPELHQLLELYAEPKYQLNKVVDGFGNTSEITYQPLLKNEVYKQSGYRPTENQVVIQAPLYVVSHVIRSNNSSGVEGLSYKYEDAVVDLFRGFLGFRKVITENHLNKIRTEDTYSLYHRYGEPMLEESKTFSDKTLIEYQKNTNLVYDYKFLGIYDTRLINTLEKKYDPKSGKLLNEIKNDFAFDDYGNLISAITSYLDGKKDELSNIYDDDIKWKKSGRLIKSIRTISAPRKGKVVKTAAFKYGSLGLLAEEIVEPDNAHLRKTTQYQRDIFGNIIEEKLFGRVDENLDQVRTTKNVFDKLGRFKIKVENALGHFSELVLDPLSGKVLESIDPNGNVTQNYYDNFYRLSKIVFPDGTWVTFQYLKSDVSIQGNRAVYKVVEKNVVGLTKTIHFDGLDREIRSESTAPMGRVIIMDKVYNNTGQLIKESLPYFNNAPILWIDKTYNTLNQLIRENYPDGTVRTFNYDGLKTSTTNQRGFSASTVSDIHGNPTQHINSNGVAVDKSYTIQNQLESISLRGAKLVSYKYNIRNQPIEKSDISSGLESFKYNAFEELIDHHTALGVTRYIKDELGRTIKKISGYDDQHLLDTIFYVYDTEFKGKLSEIIKKNSKYTKKIIYNSKGFPIEVRETIHGISSTTLHFYNPLGQLHQTVYPSTKDTILYSYDQGVVTNVKHNSELIWQLKDYDAAGHHTYFVSGNGAMTFRQYDRVNGTLLHTKTLDHRGKEIQNWDFFYNKLGSLVAQRDNLAAQQENYEYDPSEQLIKTKITGGPGVSINYNEDGSFAARSDVGEYSWESGQLVGVNFFKDIECNTSLNA
ncbi:MAG TPA: FG-GAP-like repeat-containing protein, partial [Haliscomenobacter sp.]|uniref:FG-GAP-like repeat-containing protein n=1 Tax=Haliscomenobacter sp. TaxID=2717303 RepID=UPI002CE7C46A